MGSELKSSCAKNRDRPQPKLAVPLNGVGAMQEGWSRCDRPTIVSCMIPSRDRIPSMISGTRFGAVQFVRYFFEEETIVWRVIGEHS